jgi:hypothetical protein
MRRRRGGAGRGRLGPGLGLRRATVPLCRRGRPGHRATGNLNSVTAGDRDGPGPSHESRSESGSLRLARVGQARAGVSES